MTNARRLSRALLPVVLYAALAAEGPCSGENTVAPKSGKPDAPTIGAITPGNGTASIEFTAPANTGTSAITGYTATCSASGTPSRTGTNTVSPIAVGTLVNGTTYSCTVVATNASGDSPASSSAQVTPLTVPGAPSITTITRGDASAVVAFTAPSSNGGGAITGYTATCSASGVTTRTATGSASPITVTGMTNGTSYTCTVLATNAAGDGAASASSFVTPATTPGSPTIGIVTPGDGTASIAFTAPASDGGAVVTGYIASCSSSGQTTRTGSASGSPIIVSSMTNGVTYLCNVRAGNSVGTGSASADASVKPVGAPGAPTIGAATPGNTTASVAFTAPSNDGGSAITGYTVSCTASATTLTGTGSGSPISVSGMTNGTSYSCSVKATNAIGTSAASGTVAVTPRTVPGAPTIGTATAGNASASIAFTAPASNGGAAISLYTVTCSASGQTTRSNTGTASPITVSSLVNDNLYTCSVTATNAAGAGAASGTVTVTPVAPPSTSSMWCPYNYSQQNTVALLQSTVAWTCTSTTRSMTSTQVPDYPAAKTYTGNPNAISVQNDPAVTFTLTPTASGTIYSNNVHIIGWAKNGVKFDPATAETCPTQSYCSKPGATYGGGTTWNVEALGQTLFSAGVDRANAHVQPNGAYHYHGMPDKYLSWLSSAGTDTSVTPTVQHYLIGFALDGYPIYAKYGYSNATDATSGVVEMTSSYRLKLTIPTGRPDTAVIKYGTFTQDWEYAAGTGHLDECNGRFAKTPEFPSGIYSYWITNTYPYIQRCFKGVYP